VRQGEARRGSPDPLRGLQQRLNDAFQQPAVLVLLFSTRRESVGSFADDIAFLRFLITLRTRRFDESVELAVVFLLPSPSSPFYPSLLPSPSITSKSLSACKMDDILTIRTSDGASLTVKRVHLIANSSVFADMVASSTHGDSVDLVETEKQLKPLVDALGGQLEAFEKLDEEGLEDFARLVDKYGFVLGEEMVRKKIWCVFMLEITGTKLTVAATGTSLRVTTTLSAPSSFPPFFKIKTRSECRRKGHECCSEQHGHASNLYRMEGPSSASFSTFHLFILVCSFSRCYFADSVAFETPSTRRKVLHSSAHLVG
jgi:hypothetical protein